MNDSVINASKKIWDYHLLNQTIEKCDCIFVLGSHDIRVAERGAELVLQGYAPIVIFSGGYGRLTEGIFKETEADMFAKRALEMGLRKDQIIIENKATNTGENIKFSCDILNKMELKIDSMILVQKPYMERRTYATFAKQWPNKKTKFMVTSPQISFDQYPNNEIPLEEVIDIIVGDLHRIKHYPAKGFQIHQDIPDDVWHAYEYLVNEGYNKSIS